MPKRALVDELDLAIQAQLANPDAKLPPLDPSLTALAAIARDLRHLPRQDFKARLKSELERTTSMSPVTTDSAAATREKTTATSVPRGFRTLTPYIIVQDGPGLIDFVTSVFGAEEKFRAIGSAGGIHAEVRIADTMLMIGGGGPGLAWRGESAPAALHIYVEDTDAVYRRALEAGGATIQPPADQPYGERSASVSDPFGNCWYIATAKETNYVPAGMRAVTPSVHPAHCGPVIDFLKRAFDAEEIARHTSPEGAIRYATVRIGDSILEMGDAHGPYQPMPTTFFLYVPDVDEAYRRALSAGATSTAEPADQPYGDRIAGIKDAFGHQWYLAKPRPQPAQ